MRDVVLSSTIGVDGIKEEVLESMSCGELFKVLSIKELENGNCKEESMDICFFDFIILFGILEIKVVCCVLYVD